MTRSDEADDDVLFSTAALNAVESLRAQVAEERAARLKAEAERDHALKGAKPWAEDVENADMHWRLSMAWYRTLERTTGRERDEALALLSKAREAFATTEAARQRLYAALEADRLNLAAWSVGYGPQNRAEVQAEVDTAGAAALASWADLAKILGTGE